MASSLVNSAGSLISAILESAGYHYQSSILNALSEPLKNEVGGLIYLLGICIVLFQLAVLKSSKLAPWLLIGPAIFLYIINERDSIPNAQWQFGSNKRQQQEVNKGVESIAGGSQAKVSKVFKRYVEVVGTTVSKMVDVISNTQVENDLWLMSKGQFFGNMTTLQEDDVGLRQLIHYGLLERCHHVISIARSVGDPTKRVVQSGAANSQVDEAQRYFSPSQLKAEADFNNLAHERDIRFNQNDPILDFIAMTEGLSGQSLHDRKVQLASEPYSCIDIWEFALQAIIKKSERFEAGLVKDATRIGMKSSAMKNLLLQASGEQSKSPLLSDGSYSSEQAQELSRVIAKYYLRNETRNSDHGSRLARFIGRTDIRKIGIGSQGENAFTEQARVAAQEWSEKERLTYAAHSMPTYQGLALYFLAIAFPFFALLLLIPGRATSFLLWFMLWLWIKSWDVALAIVAQVDTIFWSIYVAQKQTFGMDEKLPNDFKAAFAALEQTDPTFQMTGYYAMLSVCILGIPPITAQLILGSMRGGASLISQGMQRMSDFFAEGALVRTEQGLISQLKSGATELKSLRGLAYTYGGNLEKRVLEGREGDVFRRSGLQVQPTQPGSGHVPAFGQGNMVEYQVTTVDRTSLPSRLNANLELSGKVAFAESLAKPHRPLGSDGGGEVGSTLLQVKTLIDRNYGKAINSSEMEVLKSDINALIAHAGFEGDIERKAHELHKRMAIFRAIPVPWAENGEEGSNIEFQRHIAKFKQDMSILQSFANMATDAVGAANGLASNADGTSGFGWLQTGGMAVAGKFLMDSLSPELKSHLINMYDIKGETQEEVERNLQLYIDENVDQSTLLMIQNDLSTIKGKSSPFANFRDTNEIDEEVYNDHRRGGRRSGGGGGRRE